MRAQFCVGKKVFYYLQSKAVLLLRISVFYSVKMTEKQLSSAEAELYDRQIRLWGIESQEKLRAANVLLIGVRGLGSEIAKNILLSGINSLTILDDGFVTEEEIKQNFLLSIKSPLKNKIVDEVLLKAQALNPLVKITADSSKVADKKADFFKNFTIVVATRIKIEQILKIDNICRENSIKFIYGDVYGMFGFSVADFEEHDYYEDRPQLPNKNKRGHDGETKTIKIKGNLSYPPLNKVLVLPNTKQEVKKVARPTNLFVCMLALLEFKKREDRDPDHTKKSADIEKLKEIALEIVELYKFSNINLDELYDLIFGQVGPVCAIIGGVIAQEVIKAVSHKEATINNVFLFDPINYTGKELSIKT